MRAVRISEHGGPDVLESVEVDSPTPGPGEVLVRTTSIGVNYIDTYFREGVYQTALPYIPGSEGAGVVEAVGAGTPDLVTGDRVAWCQAPGSYAQYVVAPAESLVTVPDGVSDSVAASMLLQGLTAHYLITDTHRAHGGDTVLITAGAGGVGQLLIQMAVARGYRVITTTSTESKAQICRELGAHQVLLYPEATPERVRELSGGGVEVVFDGVGRDTFDTSLASLERRGTLVLFGAASGPVPPVDPQRLNAAGSVFLTRPKLGDFIATTEEYRDRAAEVMEGLVDGSLVLDVGATFGLTDAAQAHRALQSRRTTGSITLDPSR
ncbi:MAG: quinone oxidoreductase [Dietzia sp.]|uniref:quinone oxidoreductase family protein n=1 Tax=unclassified Dietzia TaxID=2617939 RepID=UPI0015FAF404|nr:MULTISPECIES: quinone oxidoreductase [unclassified Dietzia]MBB1040383.1 quinone oxidoreductase [Dietzia sp. Cai40]MBB1042969.1 quinone oxidoreductase [Dietzia sp. DQ11-44]MDO8393219.1 quinone oxidoreductase [Dietzia sp.]